MRYALLIYSALGAREYAEPAASAVNDLVAYVRAVKDAGILVAAEQLSHADTATSVRGEDRLVTDGPFLETKEHLLGFFLIDVPDLKTALEWAARMPPACARTVEVRAVKADRLWGAAVD
jgi:hypothetical protein